MCPLAPRRTTQIDEAARWWSTDSTGLLETAEYQHAGEVDGGTGALLAVFDAPNDVGRG